ncbi:MAG: radical SAM protein [Gemmatimonadota bacterium]
MAWNLTRRCNLACAHCYIAAGDWHTGQEELDTAACVRIVHEIADLNPGTMLVLSGGEPLVRPDLETLAAEASGRGCTVVVGTNGTELAPRRIESLRTAGVSGFAVSIDSLDARYHDRFRHGSGSLEATRNSVARLVAAELDVVVQMTITDGNRHELAKVAAWAADQGAMAFNVYFVVGTGRGSGLREMTPDRNEEALREIVALERAYRGHMLVRSKCMPQIMRLAVGEAPDSSLRRYATRCPCGLQYCRITPDGKVTPCPYNPLEAGDLRRESFSDVWRDSPLFARLREELPGGKCGVCEYREVCGGCRARAYARTGDLMAADESCAYEPTGDVSVLRASNGGTYGDAPARELRWDAAAEERLRRIPSFVRGVVAERVETYARRTGADVVTSELMTRVREELPVDFSRRRPFFLGRRS